MMGVGVATGSAWLGGHLSFRKGVGVDQTVFESLPTEWTAVIDESRLENGKLAQASVDGVSIAIVRTGGRVHAMLDRCSHRGCSLHEGTFEGNTITCPCHGSSFRLDGTIVKGPATSPQPSLDVRITSGCVQIRVRSLSRGKNGSTRLTSNGSCGHSVRARPTRYQGSERCGRSCCDEYATRRVLGRRKLHCVLSATLLVIVGCPRAVPWSCFNL